MAGFDVLTTNFQRRLLKNGQLFLKPPFKKTRGSIFH
jgi:hypothetical protein